MRTQAHIIDSMAVKTVMAQLPHHWVVRELTERDYGIDLMVEIFAPGLKDADGKDAYVETGAVFHIQIKGTEKPLEPVAAGTINHSIDKKALIYVEKFSTPFLLFRVSVTDPKDIYFLWIQRYIKDFLDSQTPMWREDPKDSLTVRIPSKNKLPDAIDKIEAIAYRPKYVEELVEFNEIYNDLSSRIEAIRAGSHRVDQAVLMDLRSRVYRVSRLNVLLARNDCCISRESVAELIQYIFDLDTPEGRSADLPDEHNFTLLAGTMPSLDIVENFVLSNDGLTAY